MNSLLALAVVGGYFIVLLALAWRSGGQADNETFFVGNRKSNWILVAFGMVGTSLSGVTFISVPGTVSHQGFLYVQVLVGNLIGYALIAVVLLPIYYRINARSIYDYLGQRFGVPAQQAGATFFILSRTLGATARLYLVIAAVHRVSLAQSGIPFSAAAGVTLLMVWLYTFRGGVKTLVLTDTLQTTFMVGGLLACITFVVSSMGVISAAGLSATLSDGDPLFFDFNPLSPSYWAKQVVGAVLVCFAMIGLDLEMMQKSISVPKLRDSQRNIALFSVVSTVVSCLFLALGALMSGYAKARGVNAVGDELFPQVAAKLFPLALQLIFLVALTSALFPSADGALTALTSSACIDLLGMRPGAKPDSNATLIRQVVHLFFALLFFGFVMMFKWIDSKSVVNSILVLAGYTYGPLLGLFLLGICTRAELPSNRALWASMIVPPLASFGLVQVSPWIFGYHIGFELIVVNAGLTMMCGWLLSRTSKRSERKARMSTTA